MRILWTDRKEIRKMNKRVTFSVLAALLFMFCVNFRTVSAADSTVIYLQAETLEAPRNVEVKTTCEMKNPTMLTNGKLRILWDKDKLKITSSEVGKGLNGFHAVLNDILHPNADGKPVKGEGELVLAFATVEPTEVSGSMLDLSFIMKEGTKLDSSSLTVTVEELCNNGQDVESQVLATEINVNSGGNDKPEPPVEDTRIDISKATVARITNKPHNKKWIRPVVKVSYNGQLLVEGTDYALSYKSNKKPGKAQVTIHGTGKFKGTKVTTFNIVPAKPVIGKVTSPAKGKIRVRWKKVKLTTGYEIQICRNKKFKKAVKKVLVKKASAKTKVIKVKAKKTYYVRMRAYKTIDGKRCYGSYSKKIKVRVR